MSGVQARLHATLKKELRILGKIVRDYMGPSYAYELDEDFNRQEDFDDRVDIIPVSDPNAATMAQRVVQYQAAMQLAQQAPNLYDMGKLHRQMLEVLGIKDAEQIVKLPDDIKPSDPVTENMAMLKQEPVKAFKYQDHEAHIQVHLAAAQDPKLQEIIGQSPFAGAIQAAMAAHVTEHVAFQYRREIEKNLGVGMPDEDKPLPEDVEIEISRLAAQAAEKLLRKDQAEVAQQQAMKQQQDPLTQIQQRELALKEAEFAHKQQLDIAKLQSDAQAKMGNQELQKERLESEERREGARLGVKIATETDKARREDVKQGIELGREIARDLTETDE
jgi:hypothetical protein